GVVGLGNMGRGIASNLDRADLLAAVWDINADALKSCGLSESVSYGLEAVASCEIILLVVPGSPQIADLFDAGLLSGPAARVFVDLTTSDQKATRALASRAAQADAAYLDAGMTGGAAGAAAGTLTLMMGGDGSALLR